MAMIMVFMAMVAMMLMIASSAMTMIKDCPWLVRNS